MTASSLGTNLFSVEGRVHCHRSKFHGWGLNWGLDSNR